MTEAPWPILQWRKTNGKPYAWFGTLVALCKPALGDKAAGTPANSELATSLPLSESAVERHMTAIYQAFGLEDDERDREVIVAIANEQGIVTRNDRNEPFN